MKLSDLTADPKKLVMAAVLVFMLGLIFGAWSC